MKTVLLQFNLDEEVTPELFAHKIAIACAKGGAIREGESVSVPNSWNGYHDLFTHKGYVSTDAGGIFREPITVADVEGSFQNEDDNETPPVP